MVVTMHLCELVRCNIHRLSAVLNYKVLFRCIRVYTTPCEGKRTKHGVIEVTTFYFQIALKLKYEHLQMQKFSWGLNPRTPMFPGRSPTLVVSHIHIHSYSYSFIMQFVRTQTAQLHGRS